MSVSCMQHMGKADTSPQSSYCTVNYVFVTQTPRLDHEGLKFIVEMSMCKYVHVKCVNKIE